MISFRGAASTLALACLLAGCSATYIDAKVSARGRPIAGAAVGVDCPQALSGDGYTRFGETDTHGKLVFREPAAGRWFHDDCTLVIERAGYAPRRLPVKSVCKRYSGNRCVRAELHAELARAP